MRGPHYFTTKNWLLDSKQQEKMIGHRTRFREKWRFSSLARSSRKEKAAIFKARTLITRVIIYAQ